MIIISTCKIPTYIKLFPFKPALDFQVPQSIVYFRLHDLFSVLFRISQSIVYFLIFYVFESSFCSSVFSHILTPLLVF